LLLFRFLNTNEKINGNFITYNEKTDKFVIYGCKTIHYKIILENLIIEGGTKKEKRKNLFTMHNKVPLMIECCQVLKIFNIKFYIKNNV
jgi:hypothetical protein